MTEGIKRQRYTTSTGAGCPWVNGQRLCGKEGNRTCEWSDRKLNEKTFEFVPYKKIGDLIFGMPRKKAKELLCNNKELLEAVELYVYWYVIRIT